jgi:hypothetical protein
MRGYYFERHNAMRSLIMHQVRQSSTTDSTAPDQDHVVLKPVMNPTGVSLGTLGLQQ